MVSSFTESTFSEVVELIRRKPTIEKELDNALDVQNQLKEAKEEYEIDKTKVNNVIKELEEKLLTAKQDLAKLTAKYRSNDRDTKKNSGYRNQAVITGLTSQLELIKTFEEQLKTLAKDEE